MPTISMFYGILIKMFLMIMRHRIFMPNMESMNW
jgi:hypothetical protein